MERGRRWREEIWKTVDTCRNHKSRDNERTIRDVGLGGHLSGGLPVRDVFITATVERCNRKPQKTTGSRDSVIVVLR